MEKEREEVFSVQFSAKRKKRRKAWWLLGSIFWISLS
jgi:hypothetical protein